MSTPAPLAHLCWLTKSSKMIRTKDGTSIELWNLNHTPDTGVLSAWARHFRNHYCDDKQIDLLRAGTSYTRSDYLLKLKFPDAAQKPGPSIRSGDFAEILIADYVEYMLRFWVPRTRYDDKAVRNESKKGSDIIGFRFRYTDRASSNDSMLVFETKAQLSGNSARDILQEAINHSAKDELRTAETLNAIKQRLIERSATNEANKVARFQSPEDNPFNSLYGAAALFSSEVHVDDALKSSDASKHPNKEKLSLVVITGPKLIELVHKLYAIAASEA
jgi:hypothetical protein